MELDEDQTHGKEFPCWASADGKGRFMSLEVGSFELGS